MHMTGNRQELCILMLILVALPVSVMHGYQTSQQYASLTEDHEDALDRLDIVSQDLKYMTELHEIEQDSKVREIEVLTGDLRSVTKDNFELKKDLRDSEIQFYETYDLKTSPTYAEVIEFIDTDRTDMLSYTVHDHDCTQFSNTVIRNALDTGLFACVVDISFDTDSDGIVDLGHMIVVFNTVDRGIIYIDPQSDKVVEMHIGMDYWHNGYYVLQYDSCFEKM